MLLFIKNVSPVVDVHGSAKLGGLVAGLTVIAGGLAAIAGVLNVSDIM